MTTSDHNTKRARELLAMMERIRAFEEQACLAAERDKLVLGAVSTLGFELSMRSADKFALIEGSKAPLACRTVSSVARRLDLPTRRAGLV